MVEVEVGFAVVVAPVECWLVVAAGELGHSGYNRRCRAGRWEPPGKESPARVKFPWSIVLLLTGFLFFSGNAIADERILSFQSSVTIETDDSEFACARAAPTST